MKTLPYSKEAYDLLHEGAQALAKVEALPIFAERQTAC